MLKHADIVHAYKTARIIAESKLSSYIEAPHLIVDRLIGGYLGWPDHSWMLNDITKHNSDIGKKFKPIDNNKTVVYCEARLGVEQTAFVVPIKFQDADAESENSARTVWLIEVGGDGEWLTVDTLSDASVAQFSERAAHKIEQCAMNRARAKARE